MRSNALFGIYDVMRIGDGELTYPVPWATTSASSAVAKSAHYREALQAAGFSVIAERNRRDFALAFFDQLRAKTAAAGWPTTSRASYFDGQEHTGQGAKYASEHIQWPHRTGRIDRSESVDKRTNALTTVNWHEDYGHCSPAA